VKIGVLGGISAPVLTICPPQTPPWTALGCNAGSRVERWRLTASAVVHTETHSFRRNQNA